MPDFYRTILHLDTLYVTILSNKQLSKPVDHNHVTNSPQPSIPLLYGFTFDHPMHLQGLASTLYM